ncbi:MAG: dihydroneopterin aldolase family protein [Thermoplasmatota archaeon]
MSNEMNQKIKESDNYFNCSDKERTAFELGIKLGALFHQFIGSPVSSKNLNILEEAMEKTTESQAFVKSASVTINPQGNNESKMGPFDYKTLSEDMLEVEIVVEYDGITAVGEMKYIDELKYPLMYLKEFKESG